MDAQNAIHPILTAIKGSWAPIAVVTIVLIYAYLDGKRWYRKRKPKQDQGNKTNNSDCNQNHCLPPHIRSYRRKRGT